METAAELAGTERDIREDNQSIPFCDELGGRR